MKDFDHQTKIFEEAKDRKFFGLLWEQGCGKTRTAIHLAENHYMAGRISAVMVITTKGLVRNWSDIELPMHAGVDHFYDVWPNRAVKQSPTGMYYWFVNVDALRTDPFVTRFKVFMKLYPNFMAIIDESTIIKSPSAKRTKRAWRIGQLARVRLIMTGLPTPRSPLDLYAQCRFLLSPNPTLGTPDALGFKDFYEFKLHHANIVMEMLGPGRTFPRIDSYKNLGELKEKLSKFSSIVRKDECLDLPPIRQRIFPVPLTNEQQGYYDELQEELLTYIEGEEIEAKNILAMINKSLQICSGQIKLPDGRYVEVPTDRLEALEELVEECQSQTIVWTAFVHNATAIGRHFGKDALLLPSGLTLDQRQVILGRFKAGEGKLLVANPASAGHGITLTNSSNIIHFSRLFNYEHRAQADARIHRIGQTEPCLITDLLDPDTLEMKVVRVLIAREQMSDFMLDRNFLKQMLKEKEMADA
jgi:SNF2 family DNA or RNA helicase